MGTLFLLLLEAKLYSCSTFLICSSGIWKFYLIKSTSSCCWVCARLNCAWHMLLVWASPGVFCPKWLAIKLEWCFSLTPQVSVKLLLLARLLCDSTKFYLAVDIVWYLFASIYLYNLSNNPLSLVTDYKYFGVHITHGLSWTMHANYIAMNGNHMIGFLRVASIYRCSACILSSD